MLLEFPPGMSVLPHSPTKSVSPVKSFWLSTKRHMPSVVCPGVYMTFTGMLPMRMMSPSSTLRSALIFESLWATIFALKVERSSALPAVWSECPWVLMMYLRWKLWALRVFIISLALKLGSTTTASLDVSSAMM